MLTPELLHLAIYGCHYKRCQGTTDDTVLYEDNREMIIIEKTKLERWRTTSEDQQLKKSRKKTEYIRYSSHGGDSKMEK